MLSLGGRILAALVATVLALLLIATTAAAGGRDGALEHYDAAVAAGQVPAGWTGSTEACTVGTESQASLDATLNALNVLREFAGVGPVSFDAAKNHRALAAALLMRAKGALSHDPPSSWPCWSAEGHLGAGTSNLFLGSSGAQAMVGYVDDRGVDSLGHRRWVLDPAAMEMGSGSTGSTNALVVIDAGGDGSRGAVLAPDTTVAWPAPGWFPAPWIFSDWTVAIGSGQSQAGVSLNGASVRVTVDGKDAQVSGVRALEPGYGTGATLAWNVALPAAARSGDHEIRVVVDGVTLDGEALPIHYTVNAFDPAAAGASDACAKAKAKLTKAKQRLKRAKRGGKATKIKEAQRKVKKARAKKRAACA